MRASLRHLLVGPQAALSGEVLLAALGLVAGLVVVDPAGPLPYVLVLLAVVVVELMIAVAEVVALAWARRGARRPTLAEGTLLVLGGAGLGVLLALGGARLLGTAGPGASDRHGTIGAE